VNTSTLTVSEKLYRRRRFRNAQALVFSGAATVFGLFWLAWILWTTLVNGFGALDLHLFTRMTPPPGEAGGLANALFGSFAMSALAIAIGAPVGVLAGTWLAEYARRSRLGEAVRFLNDILLSAPSIVLGLFVYAILVKPAGHFSAFAGALALALIALPIVVRTCDEMLQLVPNAMREAALSLGLPQWKVTVRVLWRSARPGIVTGILLALARISGETAPLLFTALNNQYWTANPNAPMASVPVAIFQFAMSPYDDWHALAWAGALVITAFVLLLGVAARWYLHRSQMAHD
jgi:phosphate transport system permease protein